MLAALQRAYRQKEPFVFLAWSPHWMNARYDFHYLEDPKNAMGTIDDPAKLYAVVNKDLKSNDPVAFALIDSMRFTKAQMDALELEIQNADSPEKGTSNWIEKNRDVVKPWIDAAKNA
jgi:glycine betaine/proline transport system substrate-binding protein